jgi:hypothetical protein
MADFYTDIHSIHYLVHQSRSKEEALKRFGNMQGFSISHDQARKALDKAMGERFLAKSDALASVVQALANKYTKKG